ncbi:hypothetical protein OBV_43270 [Oscillibacter valericigenes Sjm18-20]|nr:hypothetical protein OBV_43270 [Oscillibacter valericigenes Sjm18-20]
MNTDTLIAIISVCSTLAVVTAGSAFSAWVTQHGERKTKQTELFFAEKVKAYYNFLRISDQMIDPDDDFQITAYSETAGRALLFSGAKTQDLIGRYGKAIDLTLTLNKIGNASAKAAAQNVGKLKGELIKAMQEDLKK